MILLLLLVGGSAALIQTAVLPAFYLNAWAAPVPACALIAAWAAVKRPQDTWPLAVAGALVLGVISVERSGWFLLAFLPTVAATIAVAEVSREHRGFAARLGRATAAALVGTIGYIAMLTLASTGGRLLLERAPDLLTAAVATSVLAAVIVALMLPLRERSTGLFA